MTTVEFQFKNQVPVSVCWISHHWKEKEKNTLEIQLYQFLYAEMINDLIREVETAIDAGAYPTRIYQCPVAATL